jgi:hypothetical protein
MYKRGFVTDNPLLNQKRPYRGFKPEAQTPGVLMERHEIF